MWSNVELQITVSLNNLNNQIKGNVNVIILIMIESVQIKKGVNVLREEKQLEHFKTDLTCWVVKPVSDLALFLKLILFSI